MIPNRPSRRCPRREWPTNRVGGNLRGWSASACQLRTGGGDPETVESAEDVPPEWSRIGGRSGRDVVPTATRLRRPRGAAAAPYGDRITKPTATRRRPTTENAASVAFAPGEPDAADDDVHPAAPGLVTACASPADQDLPLRLRDYQARAARPGHGAVIRRRHLAVGRSRTRRASAHSDDAWTV